MSNRVRSDVVYLPELGGADPRSIAEREFFKLQAVIAELADAIASSNERIDALEALTEKHSERLEALENPE